MILYPSSDFMDVIKFVRIFIIIVFVLFLIILILDQITGAGIVRRLVSTVLFWIPFGNIYRYLIGGSEIIPV